MSITTKLVALIVAFIVVPMALIGMASFYSSRDQLERARLAQLEAIADLKKRQIDVFFDHLRAELVVAQDYYNIKTNLPVVAAHFADPDHPDYRRAKAVLDTQMRSWLAAKPEVIDLMLLDPQGRIVYTANPAHAKVDLGSSLPDPGNRAFDQGRQGLHLTELFRNPVAGDRLTMIAAAPARDQQGRPIGVIALEVNTDDIYHLVGDTTGLGDTGETLIGRLQDGRVQFLSPLRHDAGAALVRTLAVGDGKGIPIQEAVQGRDGSGLAIDYRGERVLAVWRHIADLDWGFVAKIDAAEAYAPIERLRTQTLTFGTAIMLLGILVALAIARSIADPVRALKGAVERIGEGDLTVRSAIATHDEVGALAQGVNRMAENLERWAESLRKLSRAVAQSPVSILIADREGRIEYVNPRFSELSGFTAEEILGQSIGVLRAGEMLSEEYDRLWRTIREGGEWRGELVSLRKDGAHYWSSVAITPVHDSAGEISHYLAVSEDVTARKQADAELRQYRDELERLVAARTAELESEIEERKRAQAVLARSEARFRELAETIREVFWIASADGRELLYVSPAYAAIWGRSPEEVCRRPHLWLDSIHPADRAGVAAVFFGVKSGQTLDVVYRIRRPDGTERWIHDQGFPITDERGALIRIVGLAADVTAQKLADDALKKSRRSLAEAQRIAHVGNWELDLVANRCDCSEEMQRIFGLWPGVAPADLGPFMAKVHPQDRESLQQLHDGEDRFSVDYRICLANGELRFVHEEGEVIRDGAGRVTAKIGTVQDVTAAKLAERALRRALDAADAANRAKGEFLANMSHEIRTPMNAVIGLSLLALECELNPRLRDYLGKILRSSQSLMRLLNDILDYSKIEAGYLELEQQDFFLDEVLSQVAALFEAQAQAKGIALRFREQPGVPQRLRGDPLRLGQALNNLVGNAVKFTTTGEIEVAVEPLVVQSGQTQLRFSVRDTGIGIAPEAVARMFEPFTQADGSIMRRFGGTGLGLAITKRLVELMGGEISVESQPGAGCLFHFSANFGEAAPADASAAVQASEPAGRTVDTVANGREAVTVDGRRAAALIDEIHALLQRSELVESGLLDALQAALGAGAAGEQLERLRWHVDRFEYDPALVVLERLAEAVALAGGMER